MAEYEDKIDKLIKKNQIIDESSIPIKIDEPIKTEEEKKKDKEDLEKLIIDTNKETSRPSIRVIGTKSPTISPVGDKNKNRGFLGGLKNLMGIKDTSINPYNIEPFFVYGGGIKYDLTFSKNKMGDIIRLEDEGLLTKEEALTARRKL